MVRSAVVATTAQIRELEDARGLTPLQLEAMLARFASSAKSDFARTLTQKRYLDQARGGGERGRAGSRTHTFPLHQRLRVDWFVQEF